MYLKRDYMKKKNYGCIIIIVSFIIVGLIVAPLVEYIGDLGIAIIIIGGMLLAKFLDSIIN